MPKVLVGEFVLWRSGPGSNDEAAAIVSAVSARSVELTVFFPHGIGYGIRDTVRHTDDPDVKAADIEESGVWRHGPMRDQLLALEQKVEELTLLVAGATPDTI